MMLPVTLICIRLGEMLMMMVPPIDDKSPLAHPTGSTGRRKRKMGLGNIIV
jgi:hypothetical protein